jgi:hypothetical protein
MTPAARGAEQGTPRGSGGCTFRALSRYLGDLGIVCGLSFICVVYLLVRWYQLFIINFTQHELQVERRFFNSRHRVQL